MKYARLLIMVLINFAFAYAADSTVNIWISEGSKLSEVVLVIEDRTGIKAFKVDGFLKGTANIDSIDKINNSKTKTGKIFVENRITKFFSLDGSLYQTESIISVYYSDNGIFLDVADWQSWNSLQSQGLMFSGICQRLNEIPAIPANHKVCAFDRYMATEKEIHDKRKSPGP